jgi:hypothetical protein
LILSGSNAARSKTSAALLLILTFVMGGVAGFISFHLYRDHIQRASKAEANPRPNFIEVMIQATGLDLSQQEMLKTIVNKRVVRYRAFDEEMRQETRAQIQQILRPDQKPKFEQLLKRWDEQRRQWEKRQQQDKSK